MNLASLIRVEECFPTCSISAEGLWLVLIYVGAMLGLCIILAAVDHAVLKYQEKRHGRK